MEFAAHAIRAADADELQELPQSTWSDLYDLQFAQVDQFAEAASLGGVSVEITLGVQTDEQQEQVQRDPALEALTLHAQLRAILHQLAVNGVDAIDRTIDALVNNFHIEQK